LDNGPSVNFDTFGDADDLVNIILNYLYPEENTFWEIYIGIELYGFSN